MAGLATAILRGLTTPEHLDDLLSRGADVADLSFVDPLGRSLVHLAADSGDVPALRWVISRGADPRKTTPSGDTALHLAAAEGHRQTVAFLLEEASVGIPGVNVAGQTALDLAAQAGHDEVVRLLARHLPTAAPPPPPPAASAREAVVVPQGAGQGVLPGVAAADDDDDDDSLSRMTSTLPAITSPSAAAAASIRAQAQPVRGEDRRPLDTAAGMATGADNKSSSCSSRGGNDKGSATAARKKSASASKPSPKGTKGGKGGGGGRSAFDERAMTEGGFFVAGAWSKAGVCSCFNVRHRHLLGKHGVVFDMGVCPAEVLHVARVFVSHGHLDHCGAIVSHARLRALSQGPPAKYYMGAELASGMDKVRKAFEEVEGASIAMDIVAVGPEDRVDLGQGCFVRPFLVKHRVDALGFALMRLKTDELKHEYRQLDGREIGALRKRGVDVHSSHETVEVVYTGDTVMDGLVSQPVVWEARMLIMEVTYLDGDGSAAAKNFHIHDVLDNMDKLGRVEQLVVAHVSERHGSHRNVLRLLSAALPPSFVNKVSVALGEFGAPEYLSFLEDYVAGGEVSFPKRLSRGGSVGGEAEEQAGGGGG
ncbi:unnamed protein product [Ectocarpus sp. CCAP 1310/34]|nr:unnamed protein product [Ectocarpus sp. CCAP 1310/34]